MTILERHLIELFKSIGLTRILITYEIEGKENERIVNIDNIKFIENVLDNHDGKIINIALAVEEDFNPEISLE